jgi:hypothetical protein
VDSVLIGAIAWLGISLLGAFGWSRFFRGMDTLPDLADAEPPPVHTTVDWAAEYQKALDAEALSERTAADKSA